jgi:sulfate transport system substrate-binding protein
MEPRQMKRLAFAAALAIGLAAGAPARAAETDALLNASYDIARELFAEINESFVPAWKDQTGNTITVNQSHAGTSRQARAILEGLKADVVTFNQVTDIEFLVKNGGLIQPGWQNEFPNQASPWYSMPSFLVRKGNPKNIHDWSDLVRDGVEVVFPNPKTSGNARYTYLAAYAFGLDKFGGDVAKTDAFVSQIFGHVAVFDTGGRGATTTFVERGIGDVLITFEAETNLIRKEYGEDSYEVVTPSQSLVAEFPVAVVDKVVDDRDSRKAAEGYLNFLYSKAGQEIAARRYNRVVDEEIAAKYADQFPELKLVRIEDVFGNWDKIQAEHFKEGAKLDQLFAAQNR